MRQGAACSSTIFGSRARGLVLGAVSVLGASRLSWPSPAHADVPAAAGDEVRASVTAVPTADADQPSQSSPPGPSGRAPGEPVALGRVIDAGPGTPSLFLLSAAGFGYTGAVLGSGDRHDRAAGHLTIDGRVLPWLGLGLRLDGRYDRHQLPGRPGDSGYVGDPRFYARVDRRLGELLRVGARLGLWLPGASAPSLPVGAASPELAFLATYAPPGLPLSVSLNAGYRFDRSARTAENAARLNPGDRLALGVSDFNAALLGASVSATRGRWEGYVEGSWELLVGARAPGALSSPLYLGTGLRAGLTRHLRAEAGIEVSPSRRPALDASAPLVVVPPRFASWVGLSYRFGGDPPRPVPVAPPAPIAPPPPAMIEEIPPDAPEAVTQPGAQLRGLVRSLRGNEVNADIEIEPTGEGAPENGEIRRTQTIDGRFEVDVEPGEYEVRIDAAGFESQRRHVHVEDNGVILLDVDLKAAR